MHALLLTLLIGQAPVGGTSGAPIELTWPSTTAIHLNDSIALSLGNTAAAPDVWFDNNGTSLCFTSTSVDGAGTDGDIFCYTLGGNTLTMTSSLFGGDDWAIQMGNTAAAPDVWFDNNGTSFCLTSTDVGAGADGDIFCYTLGGAATTVFGGNIDFGAQGRRLILDTDDDTYLYAWGDDSVQLTVGNGAGFTVTNTNMDLYKTTATRDNTYLGVGHDVDYWFEFNSSGTQFEMWSTTGAGGTTDGLVFTVDDTTDDVVFPGATINTPGSTQTLAAGTAITITAGNIPVAGDGGNVVVTAAPTVTAGVAGQQICIIGTNDAATVELQDETTIAGSLLELAGNVDVVLGIHDTVCLVYYNSHWIEVSRSDNDDT